MKPSACSPDLLHACQRILESDDVSAATALLKENPALLHQLADVCGPGTKPPLAAARSREMAVLLLDHGAKLNELSTWWAPGFGLEDVSPSVAEHLVDRGHPLDISDPRFHAIPIGWAIHSCVEAKRHPDGDFPKVIDLLLQRSATFDPRRYPTGHEGIDTVLKRKLEK